MLFRSGHRLAIGIGVCFALAACGCAGGSKRGTSARHGSEAEQPAPRPGRLSDGTVTSTVKKGQTTQAELLDLFGGPDIATIDSEGVETWVYERSASETDIAGSNDARNLNAFFGARGARDRSRTTNSVRDLTVIVKFNPDKNVRDYSVRQSKF